MGREGGGMNKKVEPKLNPTEHDFTMATFYIYRLIRDGNLPKTDKEVLRSARDRIKKMKDRYTKKVK
jgi:hypothetical protein